MIHKSGSNWYFSCCPLVPLPTPCPCWPEYSPGEELQLSWLWAVWGWKAHRPATLILAEWETVSKAQCSQWPEQTLLFLLSSWNTEPGLNQYWVCWNQRKNISRYVSSFNGLHLAEIDGTWPLGDPSRSLLACIKCFLPGLFLMIVYTAKPMHNAHKLLPSLLFVIH